MVFLPHTNTVILLEPCCGSITEPGLPVIKHIDMTVERKKELLRKREIFWQSRLKTLQPTGLNKRIG